MRTLVIPFLLFIASSTTLFAHKTHHEGTTAPAKKSLSKSDLDAVNKAYLENVKPIFRKSCFDCHSQAVNFRWYYKFPGAKQLIDRDINEAKEHLDLSKDFPFGGHGAPLEDLESIEEVVREKTMPPFRYWILHRGSKLSQEEQRIIMEWVAQSQKLLREAK